MKRNDSYREARLAEAARAIESAGPMTKAALAIYLHYGSDSTGHLLDTLEFRGVVEREKNSRGFPIWCSPSQAEAIRAQRLEMIAAVQRMTKEPEPEVNDDDPDDDPLPVRRRIVPAVSGQAVTTAPRWVFDLGRQA